MKSKILIGPVNPKNIGSIPALNRAFIDGLSQEYSFYFFNVSRKYGKSNVSKFNLLNILYFLKQYSKLIFLVLREKPKIFHYAITSFWNFEKSAFFLLTAKKLGSQKVVGHLHGGSFDVFIDNLKEKRKNRVIRTLNKIDIVIVASVFWKEFLIKNGIHTKIEVVNNPIDSNFVEEINLVKKKRNNRFLFVGALGKRKGFYDILKVCKNFNEEFALDAVGSEDRKNDLKKINNIISSNNLKSKINIVLSEKMKLEEKVDFFSTRSVFLFPSHNENFPLVIIEAACAGMPIISTRVGAVTEFFDHLQNIYFVEPGNELQIKEAIVFMIDNPRERKRLGDAARVLYEKRLSKKIVMNQMRTVYQNS